MRTCPAKKMKQFVNILLCALFLSPETSLADDVLVKVGGAEIRSSQLEQAMASAPYATQFPSMDEKDQARLRGDMLLRLIHAEALYQQALTLKLDKRTAFKQEMTSFRTGLLARRYLNRIRDQFKIPESIEQSLQQQYTGNGDAMTASRSAYVAKHFAAFKEKQIDQLKQRYHVTPHLAQLHKHGVISPNAVLLTGDGFSIKAGDILAQNELAQMDTEQIEAELEQWSQLLALARAAEDQSIDIDAQLDDYKHQLLVKLLLEQKNREWIPDKKTLETYFHDHSELGYIPERRQIGQIVVASEALAEQLRHRIQSGESLFELASQYSIDPYGREHSGDMGWLAENSGMPEIEAQLDGLADGEVSPVIKAAKGYHLVMIVNRKPAERKDFKAIQDRVKQALIAEKLPAYLKEIMANSALEWSIPNH